MLVENVEQANLAPAEVPKSSARTIIAHFMIPVTLTLVSVILALVVIAIPLLAVNINPLVVYELILQGAFGNQYAVGQSFQRSIPLIFTSLAFIFAWHADLFNIGAEGQLQLGALGATWIGLTFDMLPPLLHVSLALVVGALAGAIWGAIPGIMRAYRGINEVITTIMLNFIAVQLTILVYLGPLADPRAPYATTPNIAPSAELPILITGTRLHAGYLIALVVVVGVYFLLWRTTVGLQIRAVGANAKAAQHVGIPIRSNLVLAMVISGAIAGLGGAIEILGVAHRIGEGWSSNWGFEGIAVALLSQTQILVVPFTSLFFGMLEAGANRMQAVTNVPGSLIFLVQGLPVLFMMIFSSRRFLHRLGRRSIQ